MFVTCYFTVRPTEQTHQPHCSMCPILVHATIILLCCCCFLTKDPTHDLMIARQVLIHFCIFNTMIILKNNYTTECM